MLPVFPRFKQTVETWDAKLIRKLRQLVQQGRPWVGVFLSPTEL